MTTVDEGWRHLHSHLEWSEDAWFGFVFTQSLRQAHLLRARTRTWLDNEGLEERVLEPETPQALRELLPQLLTGPVEGIGCTWVIAIHSELSAPADATPWTEAWDWLMLRTNERRDQLLARLRGGLVFVALPRFKGRFREAAPDLWSTRSLVLELDDPPPMPPLRGALEEEPPASWRPPAELASRVEALLAQGWVSEAADVVQDLVADASRPSASTAELAAALELQAQVALGQGDLELASHAARQCLRLREQLAAVPWPERHQGIASVARCRGLLGEIAHEGGDLEAAEGALRAALALRHELVQWSADPETETELAITLSRLGDLLMERQRHEEARAAYLDALEIRRRIASELPTPRFRRYLSVAWGRLGRVCTRLGAWTDARAATAEAHALAVALADQDPGNATWSMEASITEGRLGDLARHDGDLELAERCWSQALARRRDLADQDPENARWQQYLAVSLGRLAEVLVDRGEAARARPLAEEAVVVSDHLVRDLGETRARRFGLGLAHLRLRAICLALEDAHGARACADAVEHIASRLAETAPNRAASLRRGLATEP